MAEIIKQPKDEVKDKILLAHKCVFYQQQFFGKNGSEPLANEEVSGMVSDIYAAMAEFAKEEMISLIENISRQPIDCYSQKVKGQEKQFFLGKNYIDNLIKALKK